MGMRYLHFFYNSFVTKATWSLTRNLWRKFEGSLKITLNMKKHLQKTERAIESRCYRSKDHPDLLRKIY